MAREQDSRHPERRALIKREEDVRRMAIITTIDGGLGALLIQAGLITPEQLQNTLELQKKEGGEFGQILVEQGLITAQELASITGLQWNIPFIDVTQQKAHPEALQLVPEPMARKYNVIPLRIADGALIVAMEQPWNIETINDLTTQAKMAIKPVLAVASDIQESINLNYKVSGELEEQISHITDTSARPKVEERIAADAIAQAPIVRTVSLIVRQAVKDRASDIHIEPQNNRLRIRYRIDGILHDAMSLPVSIHLPLVSRLKIMAGMNIADRRRPQDGQFSLKVEDREVDIRVASSDTTQGETIVLRILDKSFALFELTQLGFLPGALEKYRLMLNSPFGMILLSGPTGSGKTTTLYASVNQLNHDERNIMTIEDPVEYRFNNITQIQVHPRAGITFAGGLRALMRLDPDVILVGEIRDTETARTAVQSALTGHLVLSSIHANSAVGVLFRLIDLGIEPFLISSALIGVVAQRMVRRVCLHCRKLTAVPEEEQLIYEREMNEKRTEFYYGEGCNLCANTGYSGRCAVLELTVMSEELRHLLATNAGADAIRNEALKEGMVPMWHDGMLKVKQGVTTPYELLRNAYSID